MMFFFSDSALEACIDICACDHTSLSVDCSYSALDHVPTFNYLTFEAQTLKISFNLIPHIHKDAFESPRLAELTELYINDNQMQTIDPGAFAPLKNLERLYAAMNRLTEISARNQADLHSLIYLDLSFNEFIKLSFQTPMSLRTLVFQYNGVQRLTNTSFSGLNKLQSLDMTFNPISSLESDGSSLVGLESIRSISFASNLFFTSPPASAFQEVAGTLESLSYHKNLRLQELSPMDFSSLQHLDVSFCKLGNIPNNTFSGAATLQSIDVSYSEISTISRRAFSGLGQLTSLNLSGNVLYYLPYNSLLAVSSTLKVLVADFLPLTTIHAMQDEAAMNGTLMEALEDLSFSNNRLVNIQPNSFFSNLHNLKRLQLSSTKLDSVPRDALSALSSLELLEFNGNPITK